MQLVNRKDNFHKSHNSYRYKSLQSCCGHEGRRRLRIHFGEEANPMNWILRLFLFCLVTGTLVAQHDSMAMHHKHGMAKLEVQNDASAQVLTIRLGPVNLPAHADHMEVA